jgi:hypothetical protein
MRHYVEQIPVVFGSADNVIAINKDTLTSPLYSRHVSVVGVARFTPSPLALIFVYDCRNGKRPEDNAFQWKA